MYAKQNFPKYTYKSGYMYEFLLICLTLFYFYFVQHFIFKYKSPNLIMIKKILCKQ